MSHVRAFFLQSCGCNSRVDAIWGLMSALLTEQHTPEKRRTPVTKTASLLVQAARDLTFRKTPKRCSESTMLRTVFPSSGKIVSPWALLRVNQEYSLAKHVRGHPGSHLPVAGDVLLHPVDVPWKSLLLMTFVYCTYTVYFRNTHTHEGVRQILGPEAHVAPRACHVKP